MSIDHSNNPEGATHRSGANFYRKTGPTWMLLGSGGKWIATATDWSWLELNAVSLEAEWDGEGLPPVGTACIMIGCADDPDTADFEKYKSHVGSEVSIIAHRDVGTGVVAAVYEISIGGGMFEYYAMCADCFEPRKTQEQIAAEERENTIANIRRIILHAEEMGGDPAIALEANGYRKQVTD